MKHLKSFPIFEGNMQDAQYAESVYLNSPEGKDLAAINYWGYRLPRTGYFYITERYSEYKLEKNLAGKWTATTTTKSRIDLGEFDTVEECLRRIWAWLVIKSGIPKGARIKDYTNWLMNPNCPIWGKALKLGQIDEEYTKELLNESPGIIDDITGIFTGPSWKEKFDIIGVGIKEQRRKKDYCDFYLDKDSILKGNLESPFLTLWQALNPEIANPKEIPNFNRIEIPGFSVNLSLRKEFKTKELGWGIDMKIGDNSLEAIENKIIARYIKKLKKVEAEGYGPGEHPLLEFLIDILEGRGISENIFKTVCDALVKMVGKDYTKITTIPPMYAKEVARLVGLDDEEVNSIRTSIELGLL
jgi:hypothetical protein